jgi:hypothetical protein
MTVAMDSRYLAFAGTGFAGMTVICGLAAAAISTRKSSWLPELFIKTADTYI